MPCFDADVRWLPAGHAEFASLPDTRVNAPGQFSFGLALELMQGPVTLHVSSPDSVGRDVHALDFAQDASLSASFGLAERLELFATLPVRVFQTGTGAAGVASQSAPTVSSSAIRDPRLGLAYSFDDWLSTRGLGLRAALEASLPLGEPSAFAGESGPVVMPNLILGYRLERLAFRAELGARLREKSEFGDVRLGNQGFIAVGAGMDALSRGLAFFSLEAYAMPPLSSSRASASSANVTSESWLPAEWLFAASSSFVPHGPWQLSASIGTGIPLSSETRNGSTEHFIGLATPAWRTMLSLRFSPR